MEEPKQAKIYNIDSRNKNEKKETELEDPEVLIQRIDICAKKEGLKNGYYSSEEEITAFLKKEGVDIIEIGETLKYQLAKYIGTKYGDFIFNKHGNLSRMKNDFLLAIKALEIERKRKMSENDFLEWHNLEQRAKDVPLEKLIKNKILTEEEYIRMMQFRFMNNPNLSYEEASEIARLQAIEFGMIKKKLDPMQSEFREELYYNSWPKQKLTTEEKERLIALRKKASSTGNFLLDDNFDDI